MVQAGTQLPPLLEGDETTQDGTSSSSTAVQALSSQVVSSVDFGSGELLTVDLLKCTNCPDRMYSTPISVTSRPPLLIATLWRGCALR